MTRISSFYTQAKRLSFCFLEPYRDGCQKISYALFRKYAPLVPQPSKLSIDPQSHIYTQNKIPLKQRVSQFCYGLALLLPFINHIITLAIRYFSKESAQEKVTSARDLLMNKFYNSEIAFNINLSLLHSAYEKATPEDKKLISWMSSNYLNHITPKHLASWIKELKKYDSSYVSPEQSSPFQEYRYHREILDQKLDYGKRFNAKLALGNQSLFLATDTKHINHVFPAKFKVINIGRKLSILSNYYPKELTLELEKIKLKLEFKTYLKTHFKSLKDLNPSNLTPIILDLTEPLEKFILTNGEAKKEISFNSNFLDSKRFFHEALKKAIDSFTSKNPVFRGQDKVLYKLIQDQATCIVRTKVDEVSGIKILPFGQYDNKDKQFNSPLIEFMVHAGISIGALNLRKTIPDVFEQAKEVPFLGKDLGKTNFSIYPQKDSILSLNLFKRLETLFACGSSLSFKDLKSKTHIRPHFLLFGKTTLDMIKGLLQEISKDNWNQIRNNSTKNYICQTALYQIYIHLSNAETYMRENRFDVYMQEIEIVHAEIQKLLTLFSPFAKGSFHEIMKFELSKGTIPPSLQSYVQAGVARSATNIFAGITACTKELSSNFESAHAQESYFEHSWLTKHRLEDFLNAKNDKQLDLYHAQFNPNVNVGSELTEYKKRNIANDIRDIFNKGRAGEHFTAAIDITIDEFYSSNVHELLLEFRDEIENGQINFVFFSSGQKFSTLGLDNYYGSTFFMVNNKAKKWTNFNNLLSHPCYKTDSLSENFFCLSTKYGADALSNYRKLIFENTKTILKTVPSHLLANTNRSQPLRVNKVSDDMLPAFIDLKVAALPQHQEKQAMRIQNIFLSKIMKRKVPVYQRGSFGFFHCNFAVFGHLDKKVRTIRINPGVNPDDLFAFMDFFVSI
jgi:hypothetical protein